MAENYPKISIITPNYNGASYLEETMLSVLNQDYPNLEYIVMDGGSSDSSLEIIKKYESKLSYWESKPDLGQADAINKGLKRATGDWIAFLNSDDLYVDGAFFSLLQATKNYSSGLWFVGGTQIFGNSGEIYRTRFLEKKANSKPIDWVSYKTTAPQLSTFWNSSILKKTGLLNSDFHFSFDCDYWLRMELAGFSPISIQSTWAKFRFHEVSKTAQSRIPFLVEHRKMLDLYRAQFNESEIRATLSELNHFEALSLARTALEQESPRKELAKAFKLSPKILLNRMFLGALKRSFL